MFFYSDLTLSCWVGHDKDVSDSRVQLDLKLFPDGVIPTLRELAKAKGLELAPYCRTILIEHALEKEKHGEAAHPR